MSETIVSIAKEKDAAVIVIKGTESHDFDQIDNLKVYESDNVYFVDEPTVLDVKGMKIYCLPDIHIKSVQDEKMIYDYSDNEFDMILGQVS